MRRIWEDVKDHRRDSGLFLLYWAAAYALHAIPRWNRENNAADILEPVLQLHLLLPVVAGALLAWWRRNGAGKIAGGMFAGAAVLTADFLLLVVPELVDNWLRNWPGGHHGEDAFELPALAIGISLFGSILGFVGAATVTAVNRIVNGPQSGSAAGRPSAPMPRNPLLVGGGLAWAVALVIVIAVIPGVRADTFVGAAQQRAATAFTYSASLNLAVGMLLLLLSRWRSIAAGKPLAATAGLLALFLGTMMLLAVRAFSGHGPGMRHVVIACIPCAGGDLAAGTLALLAALRQPSAVRDDAMPA